MNLIETPAPRRLNWGVFGAILSLVAIILVARYAVTHLRRPGSMSVIEAQAMDMSVMKPPIGAVPVEVVTAISGPVRARVSYSGSVLAFNEQIIAPRVTGRIVSMPVYPGDRVRRGQLLVRLDSDELRAKENSARAALEAASQDRLIAGNEADSARSAQNQARAEAARAAGMSAEGAAQVELARSNARGARAEIEAAQRGVSGAQSEVGAARAERAMAGAGVVEAGANLSDARAEVENARALVAQSQARLPQAQAEASAARAALDFARQKRERSAELLKQGAISREEFQADDAAFASAQAQVSAAGAKVREAGGDIAAAQAGVRQASAKLRAAGAKLSGARAGVARAEASIVTATEKVAQMRVAIETARAKSVGSQTEIEAARARLAQSRSGIDVAQAQTQGAGAGVLKAGNQAARAASMAAQAQSQLAEAAVVRGYTQIRALADGVVTKRLMAPGSLVNAGQTVLEIAQISRVRFQASVAQSDLDAVRVGAPVRVRSASNASKSISTVVSAVFPAANSGSRTGIIEAVAPNANFAFKPGEAIVMEISVSQTFSSQTSSAALKVPSEALIMAPQSGGEGQVVSLEEGASVWTMERVTAGKPSIYTCTMHPQIREEKPGDCPICHMKLTPLEAGGNFRARLVSVKTGATDGEMTEIVGGLPSGAKVITRGFDDLKDGDSVVATRFGSVGPLQLPSANTKESSSSSQTNDAMGANAMGANAMGATGAMGGMKMKAPTASKNASEIRISIDEKGFSPANFELKQGVRTRLVFTRTTEATCATEIVWPDFKINRKLPLNVPVSLEITPRKSGASGFACGMNMLKGAAVIR